jgi:hypothetical protein
VLDIADERPYLINPPYLECLVNLMNLLCLMYLMSSLNRSRKWSRKSLLSKQPRVGTRGFVILQLLGALQYRPRSAVRSMDLVRVSRVWQPREDSSPRGYADVSVRIRESRQPHVVRKTHRVLRAHENHRFAGRQRRSFERTAIRKSGR